MADASSENTPAQAPAPKAATPAPAPKAAPAAPAEPALIVSSSPHFHTKDTVDSIMRWVLIALAPACCAGVYFFGWDALRVLCLCTFGSVALEWLAARIMGKSIEIRDGSAAVTGLLLGMNLPSNTPWWICLIGCFMAVVVGKMIFGGLGCNPFNPALVGRVALLLAFPVVLTTWPTPRTPECLKQPAPAVEQLADPATSAIPSAAVAASDSAVIPKTTATPLKWSKLCRMNNSAERLHKKCTPLAKNPAKSYWHLFLGLEKGGSLGETCGLALLVGGILLICLNIVRWQIPVFYLTTVVFITGIAWLINPDKYADPLFHVLTGGLLLGAFFMATDMVTTPLSRLGAIYFAIGCGILTSCIRLWGSYPEGVSFSILIMNAFTPLIDRATAGKPFGMPKKKGIKMPS